MNYEDIEKLFNEAGWRDAKTMPKIPHAYTLRKNWEDQRFVDVVNYIREHGRVEEFRIYNTVKEYTYLYIGDYKYWTMGAPIEQTILINRARI
jgi:hypothetical protein